MRASFSTTPDTAEDVIELVFLKLFRGDIPISRINERYLRTAVLNECRRVLRWEHRFVRISGSLLGDIDRAGRIDAMVDLDRLLSSLPPDCAGVVRGRMTGLKNREIAAQLGVSAKAVCERYQRAKALIRLQACRRPERQPTILRRNASNTKMVVAGPGAGRLQTSERSGSE